MLDSPVREKNTGSLLRPDGARSKPARGARRVSRLGAWARRRWTPWRDLEPGVADEIGGIYCGRVPLIATVAAAVAGVLTGADLIRRFAVGDYAVLATDVNSLAFAAVSATIAVAGYSCRRRGSGSRNGLAFAVAFTWAAFAHGVAILVVGSSFSVPEVYLIIILLAAAGGVPLPPRAASVAVSATALAATVAIGVSRHGSEDIVLPLVLVWVIGILTLAIDFENFAHWRASIRNRVREEQARRQLERFLSILAHDLRAPIGNMDILVSLIQDELGKADAGTAAELLGHMKTTASETYGLLDNLLLWARSRRGALEPVWDTVDLGREVESVADSFAAQSRSKEVTVLTEAPPNLVLTSDADLLRTILRNLIGNAIKFTPTGGSVTVRARATGPNECAIVVEDTGVGMDRERQETLFDLDRVRSRPGTAGETGNGLGLILVRELAHRLGGTISVDSSPGEGTSIAVTLSLERRHPADDLLQ